MQPKVYEITKNYFTQKRSCKTCIAKVYTVAFGPHHYMSATPCTYVNLLLYIDITGVSPSEGSVNGGTMITIYGEYFDPNADSIEVLVGGKLQTATNIH